LEILQATAGYEFGETRSSIHAYFGARYPVYFRGTTYLAARQCSQAALEFHKIIDHPGLTAIDPIGALTYLE
jgi:hypothetical protein